MTFKSNSVGGYAICSKIVFFSLCYLWFFAQRRSDQVQTFTPADNMHTHITVEGYAWRIHYHNTWKEQRRLRTGAVFCVNDIFVLIFFFLSFRRYQHPCEFGHADIINKTLKARKGQQAKAWKSKCYQHRRTLTPCEFTWGLPAAFKHEWWLCNKFIRGIHPAKSTFFR